MPMSVVMDIQAIATLSFGGVLAGVAVFNSWQNYSTAHKLEKVATSEQLDGQLTLYRKLVREEAEGRIASAESVARNAFLRGVESAKNVIVPASAIAVANVQKAVDEAKTTAAKVAEDQKPRVSRHV